MVTDLFTVASGVDPRATITTVPPACRRAGGPPPSAARDADDVVLEFPEWRPRRPARHLLPSLSVLTEREFGVRFEVRTHAAGRWSPWVGTVTLGPRDFAPVASSADGLVADVDVYRATVPAEVVRLRVRLHADEADAVLRAPWVATLSACDLDAAGDGATAEGRVDLGVAPLSQLDAPADIARRICSPASVAMVLGYLGAPVDVATCAVEMFHRATDRYGVWPAAILAAGRRGVLGYLLRFPDWASAAWCLGRGLPVIASVRYDERELTGAALPATDGHLVVLTGYDGDDVLVNDPIAPAASVRRRYRLGELRRVWLERSGVGYVLFRAVTGAAAASELRGG